MPRWCLKVGQITLLKISINLKILPIISKFIKNFFNFFRIYHFPQNFYKVFLKFYTTFYKYSYLLSVLWNISLILCNILSKYAKHFVQNFIKTSPFIISLNFSKKKSCCSVLTFWFIKTFNYKHLLSSHRTHLVILRRLIGFYIIIIILHHFLRNYGCNWSLSLRFYPAIMDQDIIISSSDIQPGPSRGIWSLKRHVTEF